MSDDKGRQLLINAYSNKIVKKKKTCFVAIKRLLHNIFHTQDDEFIEDALRSCRGSSQRLMKYIDKNPEMEHLTDNAITNIILLMLTKEGKPAKKHQLKKQFSLLCSICNKAMQTQDHNTAFIIDKALNSAQLQSIPFKRPKQYHRLQHIIHAQHGQYERLYYIHIMKAIQAFQSENSAFIPIASVFDIHSKKATALQTAAASTKKNRSRNSWQDQAKLNSMYIQHIIACFKKQLETQTGLPLIKLYTQSPETKTSKELFEISEKIISA